MCIIVLWFCMQTAIVEIASLLLNTAIYFTEFVYMIVYVAKVVPLRRRSWKLRKESLGRYVNVNILLLHVCGCVYT